MRKPLISLLIISMLVVANGCSQNKQEKQDTQGKQQNQDTQAKQDAKVTPEKKNILGDLENQAKQDTQKEQDPQYKQEKPNSMILVKGGTFKNTKSSYYNKNITVPNFYAGKYEVTQKEWTDIMGSNPSSFKGDNLPVETVNWYDCIEYCNKRSEKEGLKPYYNIDKDKKDDNNKNSGDSIKWTITINEKANGYRLPTEVEWEYASSGGQESKSFTYSGSNEIEDVAWTWKNSGDKALTGAWNWTAIEGNKDKTKTVGTKKENELGLYDMSGSLREWCWDWYSNSASSTPPTSGSDKLWKGGGWLGDTAYCEFNARGKYEPYSKGYDQGFRVFRSE